MKKFVISIFLAAFVVIIAGEYDPPLNIGQIKFRDISKDFYGNVISSRNSIGEINSSGKAVVINFFTASFC